MKLTTDGGSHTNQTIIKDLQGALDIGDYRNLQATLKAVRDAGVIDVGAKLTGKQAELEKLTQGIIQQLQSPITKDATELEKMFFDIPHEKYTEEALKWYGSKAQYPDDIVMILKPHKYPGMENYITFAQDAVKMQEATDRTCLDLVMAGVAIPSLIIPGHRIKHYRTKLTAQNITLKLIHYGVAM